MRISKFIIASLLLLTVSISLSAQNIDPELLKKAKMFGVTEEQIQSELSKQSFDFKEGPDYLKNEPNPYAPRVSDTINVTELALEERLLQMPGPVEDSKTLGIYGQYLFRNSKITYEPNLNIATPIDYVLSVGDEIIIDVWGESEFKVKESISPDGMILIPNLGPININGMTVSAAQEYVKAQLSKINQSIGSTSQIMLSVGQIRSIKVSITGEVITPGTYTVPSLATLFHVMHISGGTTDIGDLRNIEIYRKSKKIASMDIYNFIMNGNSLGNIILKDGDVIVVPPYEIKASVTGEIKRPMYYLMKDGESVSTIINYGAGFRENAYKSRVKVFRKGAEYNEVITVDKIDFDKVFIHNGDSVIVETAKDEFKNLVQIDGAVWYPGDFQLNETTNMLSKLIEYAGGLKGSAFSKSAIIERRNSDYTKSVINFNPTDIVSGTVADIQLHNYDIVSIPTVVSLQEDFTLTIYGEVNTPDTLVFKNGMRIEDAIILAGGLKESASLSVVEVARRINNNTSLEYTDDKSTVYSFAINEDLSLTSESKDFILKPYDIITVRKSPQYKEQTTITIKGEVLMPGLYTIESEDTYLSDVITMSKGVTPNAYIKGANLLRRSAETNITKSVSKLQQTTKETDSLSINVNEIQTYAVAINLEKALLDPKGKHDILLQEGDVITIPKFSNIVNTIGAVYYPNATIYKGAKIKQYIENSGGYVKMARKHPFVVYQNGMVRATKRVFFIKIYPKIEPGCLVVVPKKSAKTKMSFAEILGLASSTTSLAASLGTLGLSFAL